MRGRKNLYIIHHLIQLNTVLLVVCSVACSWAVLGVAVPLAARGAPLAPTFRLAAIRLTAVAVRPSRRALTSKVNAKQKPKVAS